MIQQAIWGHMGQLYDTVYPKKYAHGFVVLCFVVVMQSFIMNSHEVFIHIHQGCFAGTGAIVRLPQCQWSKPDGYGEISQCITTTKHSKAKTVCIFHGIYCITVPNEATMRYGLLWSYKIIHTAKPKLCTTKTWAYFRCVYCVNMYVVNINGCDINVWLDSNEVTNLFLYDITILNKTDHISWLKQTMLFTSAAPWHN